MKDGVGWGAGIEDMGRLRDSGYLGVRVQFGALGLLLVGSQHVKCRV